jgi:hypothetical protein
VGRTNKPSIWNRHPPSRRCSSTISYNTKPVFLISVSTTSISGAPLLYSTSDISIKNRFDVRQVVSQAAEHIKFRPLDIKLN